MRRRGDDEIRLADVPAVGVVELARLRHVGGLPCGAPASTHLAIVSISSSRSDGSFLKLWMPTCGSRNHGGISCAAVFVLIDRAHGRTSSYVRSDIGAIWPGRWQI